MCVSIQTGPGGRSILYQSSSVGPLLQYACFHNGTRNNSALLRSTPDYIPSSRPWYAAGMDNALADAVSWTAPYLSLNSGGCGVCMPV